MAEELLKEVQHGIAELFNDGKKTDSASSTNEYPPSPHPFAKLEKSAVLLATRDFHDSSKVTEHPKKCVETMVKLLYLHLQNGDSCGESLSRLEATEVFFASTMLFVSKDSGVKRMVYLFIKEVCGRVDPSDVIIVTSCLTKDMTCDVDLYRANALRTLVHIIDSAMLGAIERYVKQAIIDKSSMVSSSALVSSLHFFKSSNDSASIVKRWVREITEALNSPCDMVQFHATTLLYQIKRNDRLAVSKFVQTYSPKPKPETDTKALRSPLAILCLIRYTTKLLHDEITSGRADTTDGIQTASQLCTSGYRILQSSLRHPSDLVAFEAARSICTLPDLPPEDIRPAVPVLHLLLSSPKPSRRMGAVKTLDILASTHPRLVAKFNEDLERLLGDSNRLIGTLSIVTLLKTQNQDSVDRLLKSISTFLTFIADEYKVMVVRSLQQVCNLFPHKHPAILSCLSKFLREEGGFRFKTTVVSSAVDLMTSVPESTDASLLFLCEFIEDCEFVGLSTQILHVLGRYGPKASHPARYVRFVYNRVILEKAAVRAAAVVVLGKFGAGCPSLRGSILVMLRRCVREEDDDEVRDRAVLALMALERAEEECPYVESEGGTGGGVEESGEGVEDPGEFLLSTRLPMSFDNLRKRLELYQSNPTAMESTETLSLDVLPVVVDTDRDTAPDTLETTTDRSGYDAVSSPRSPRTGKRLDPSAILYAVPEFAPFGRVFRSSAPVPLTENEAEYVVRCIKHVYERNVVLQFLVENTIEDQRLADVSVAVDGENDLFEPTGEIPADTIVYGASASCFTVLRRNVDAEICAASVVCELKFVATRVDPDTGEDEGEPSEEEYALEDVEIRASDFIAGSSVRDFKRSWAAAAAGEGEVLQKFSLRQKKLDEAIEILIGCLGMEVCDGTRRVRKGAKQHMIHLSGTFLGGIGVLARAQVSLGPSNNTVLKIAVRSKSAAVSKMVAESIS